MICVRCERVITGEYEIVDHGFSMSGARPDSYAHPADDPECRSLAYEAPRRHPYER